MEFMGSVLRLWTLTVLFFSSTQDESFLQSCNSKEEVTQLSPQLKRAVQCGDSLFSGWSDVETAQVLTSINTLAQRLHTHQLTDCEVPQHQCPQAEAPENGGLLCATFRDRRYCKPLCNYGYDFDFLRLSRVFEECSNQTGHKWSTQYVGGHRLAVCNENKVAVAGARSSYFPKDQPCLQTKANSSLRIAAMERFFSELQGAGHQEEPESSCLVCGLTR